MLNLKVSIDHNSGFCFGVVYAIEIAEDILQEEGHLYCLGDIVHNDEEVRRLEQMGLRIINHDEIGRLLPMAACVWPTCAVDGTNSRGTGLAMSE